MCSIKSTRKVVLTLEGQLSARDRKAGKNVPWAGRKERDLLGAELGFSFSRTGVEDGCRGKERPLV